jgi:hypothetical protein
VMIQYLAIRLLRERQFTDVARYDHKDNF